MRIVLIIIAALIALGAIGFFVGSLGIGDIKKMVINDVDLSKIDDGVYTGMFKKVRWLYEFEVTVKDHKIVSVKPTSKVKADYTKIANAAAEAIVRKQSVRIDAVCGATVDTKAIQKAVENALSSPAVR